MRVLVRDHFCLGMTRISLNCFNIATIQLQLVGYTGMPKAVEYYRWKIILANQLLKGFRERGSFRGHPVISGKNQIIV